MNTAYLLTGGNMGNREENLARARSQIGELGVLSRVSSLYETAAWGKPDQPSFLNQCMELNTNLPALSLLKELLHIEKKIGRVRKEKYGPRLIDIDILLFSDKVINDPGLSVPHPEMQNRRFALTPLAEIAPGLIHPVFNKSISVLLSQCPDKLEVKKYEISKG